MDFKFSGKYIIEMELVCRTGLHIGGLAEGYEIGGMDNPVTKTATALTVRGSSGDYIVPAECPYIPGSSLKGKLRSLLEWAEGEVKIERDKEGNGLKAEPHTCDNDDCSICLIFGSPAKETTRQGPTRLSVLDAFPTESTIKQWEKELGTGIFTEVKPENVIDRLTSQANPRQMERVPGGSRFHVIMVYDLYQKEKDKQELRKLFETLRLLEDSSLGGSGSRGSGRVAFENLSVVYRSVDYYKEKAEEVKVLEGSKIRDILAGFEKIFAQ